MTIKITVTHEELNPSELAALLWDGINLASERGDYDATCAITEAQAGYEFSYRKAEIRGFVHTALRDDGRISVTAGPRHRDNYTGGAGDWCAAQVKRAFG